MLNIFRSIVLISLTSFLYYYYKSESDLERRAPITTNFINQCSLIEPNLVALSILNIGPHLKDWLDALDNQQTKVTFFLDRPSLKNKALVQELFNKGHNIAIDARAESLTTGNIVATLRELGNFIGPITKKTPRFYTVAGNNAEELASAALPSALYAVSLNTDYLQSGDIIAQVGGAKLTGTQTILGMVDSEASQITMIQFATFLATLKQRNNLVPLVTCTQKQSAYDNWYADGAPATPTPSGDGPNVGSSGSSLKWFLQLF